MEGDKMTAEGQLIKRRI